MDLQGCVLLWTFGEGGRSLDEGRREELRQMARQMMQMMMTSQAIWHRCMTDAVLITGWMEARTEQEGAQGRI